MLGVRWYLCAPALTELPHVKVCWTALGFCVLKAFIKLARPCIYLSQLAMRWTDVILPLTGQSGIRCRANTSFCFGASATGRPCCTGPQDNFLFFRVGCCQVAVNFAAKGECAVRAARYQAYCPGMHLGVLVLKAAVRLLCYTTADQ